ncbi:MAG: metallophosphoesterase family protein [Methanogenium sp.]|jgi:DNA repair exonuclease SbcCD nuclease subunit
MKLGFFTDSHIRADNPEGRTDNFRQSILTKLEEISQIWKDNGVQAVLFGGDLFHTPDAAKSIINDVIPILRSWQLPIIGVVGSHDYFGYQLKSLKRTALGHFVKFDCIQLVGDEDLIPEINLDIHLGEGIFVTGTSHSYWFADTPDSCKKTIEASRGIKYLIQLVHGDLFNKPVPWPHLLTSQIKTESDLVLSGHIHTGWPNKVIKHGNTKFVNPGGIARIDNTGVQRTPMVCIIDVYDNKKGITHMDSKIDFIPLTSALPHPFKEKTVQEEENVQDISKLISLISSTKVEVVDIKAKLPLAAKELNMSDSVLNRAFELIESVSDEKLTY